MENENNISKIIYLGVFELVTYKNTKINGKFPVWETKEHKEKSILLVVFISLGTKTLKCMNSTLYGEKEQSYKKIVFPFFSEFYVPNRQNACNVTYIGKRKRNFNKCIF